MRLSAWWKKSTKASARTRRRQIAGALGDVVPDLRVTPLEPRRVLNADGAISELVVDAGDAAADGQADSYHIEAQDDQVQVSVNGQVVQTAALDQIRGITLMGSSDDDHVVLDLSDSALADLQLRFEGAAGNDLLTVINDRPLDQITQSLDGVAGGHLDLAAGGRTTSVDYQGFEQLELRAESSVLAFQFGDGRDQITLGMPSDPEGDAGTLQVTDGHDQAFVVSFVGPRDLLTIDTTGSPGSGDRDSVQLGDYRADGRVEVVVEGDADDRLTLVGRQTLAGGGFFAATGQIDVQGHLDTVNGSVALDASHSLSVHADASISADQGSVWLSAPSLQQDGAIRAAGGSVVLDSGDAGVTLVRGLIDVSTEEANAVGGQVQVLGMHVGLADGARIDASGTAGGGRVLVGGDLQGNNEAVRNAARTYVGSEAVIRADAKQSGDGGRVIFWADEIMRFYGTASARGGAIGGDGGLVEVSGKEMLDFAGSVDTSAARGATGLLLLDPLNILITDGAGNANDEAGLADGAILFADVSDDTGDSTTGTSEISQATLEGLAAATNITLQALNSITIEDLTDNELLLDQTGSVTFLAGAGGFTMLGAATDTIRVTGSASLTIDMVGSGGTGDGAITVGGLETNSGAIFLDGTTITLHGDVVSDGGGSAATAGAITFDGAVDLAAGVTVDSDGSTTDAGVTFASTLSGAQQLNLAVGTGTLAFNGNVGSGGLTALSGLQASAGTITLGGSVETSGAIDLTSGTAIDLPTLLAGGNLTVTTATGNITDSGVVTVSGTTSLNVSAGGSILVDQTGNTFTGNVSVSSGVANLSISDTTALDLAAISLTGNLIVVAAGITDSGTLAVTGNASFTTVNADDTIDLGTLEVDGTVAVATTGPAGDVTLGHSGELQLATSSVGGDLIVAVASGDLLDTGTVTVTGDASFTVSNNNRDIILNQLAVSGTVSLDAQVNGNVTVVNATALDLGTSSSGGTFSATATTGDLTSSGDLTIGGAATFTANGAGASITVADPANDFSDTVTFGGGDLQNVTVYDTSSLDLGALTLSGNLTATAAGLTDSGNLTVAGNATFATLGTNESINLGTLDVSGTIEVTTYTNGDVTLVNAGAIDLGASSVGDDLDVTATTGDITSSGALIVGDNADFTADAAGASIQVDNSGNSFGDNVSFHGAGGLANVSVYDTTQLVLQSVTISGNLTATAAGISDSGTLTVGGTASFATIADDQSINLGTLAVTGAISVATTGAGGDVTLVNSLALDLASASVGGNLDATAESGDLTGSGAVVVGGDTQLTAEALGASILFTSGGNDFTGTVTFDDDGAGLANLSIVDSSALDLQSLDISGTLTVVAAGITDSGTLTVGSTASFSTQAANETIVLDQLEVAGAIAITTSGADGDVTLTNAVALQLAASTIGGDLIAIATTGNLTDSGLVTVAGSASFTTAAAGADITLDTLAVSGPVALQTNGAGGNALIQNAGTLTLGPSSVGGSLSATAGSGNLIGSGALQVGGNATFTATVVGGSILVDNPANQFDGTVTFLGGGLQNVAVSDTTSLVLGGLTITGNLTVVAAGISDSGLLTVGGDASFTTVAADQTILLNTLGVAGTVAVSTTGASGDVTLVNTNTLNLAASNVGGNLSATASAGNIVGSGSLTVVGNSTFNTAFLGASVLVNDNGNNFGGSVSVTGGGLANVSIYDNSALVLETITVSGNLTVVGAGITDSGVITVGGIADFSTLADGQDIVLNTLAVSGQVRLETTGAGSDVLLSNSGNLILGVSNVGGNLTATATAGDLFDLALVTVGGDAVFTTTQLGELIVLNTLDVAGSVSLNTNNGTAFVLNASGLELGASSVGGDLTAVAATGDIVNSGALLVGGNAAFVANAAGASISVDNSGNLFAGAVQFSGVGLNHVSVYDNSALDLQALTLTGDLTAIAAGITDSGVLSVAGAADLQTLAGGQTILVDTAAILGPMRLSTVGIGGDATIVNATPVILDTSSVGGDLNVTAAVGDITSVGPLLVGGNTILTANGIGASILVDDSGNDFTGTVTFTGIGGLNDVSVFDNSSLLLGGLTLTGNLTVVAAGVADVGLLTVTGDVSASTLGADQTIILNSLAVGGQVDVTTSGPAGTVLLASALPLNLAASTVGGNLIVFSPVVVSSEALTVDGNTILNAGVAGTVSLTSSANNFSGSVSILNALTAVLVNSTATDLGASTVGGLLDVTAAGAITDSGVITVGGPMRLTTLDNAGGDVILDNLASSFGELFVETRNTADSAVVDATIRIFESGITLVGSVSTGMTTGQIEIVSSGGIHSAAGDPGVADVSGANLVLEVTGAGATIGQSELLPLEISGLTLSATSAGNLGDNLFIRDVDGDLTLGVIDAGAGDVYLAVDSGGLDASAPATPAVIAGELTLRITDGATLTTEVNALDVINSANGDVTISDVSDLVVVQASNQTPGDANATTGTVSIESEGTLQIAFAGGGVSAIDGNISLTGNLVNVLAPVSTTEMGNIVLTSDVGQLVLGADGDVSTQAGQIEVNAATTLSLSSGTILQTDAGQISGSLLNSPNPFLGSQSVGTPLSDTNRIASIDVRIADPLSSDVGVEIDWLEGDAVDPAPLVPPENLDAERVRSLINGGVGPNIVRHEYDQAPDPENPGNDILVQLRIVEFAAGTISLNQDDQPVLIQMPLETSVNVEVTAPLVPFFPQLPPLDVIRIAPASEVVVVNASTLQRQFQITAPQELINSIGTTAQKTERYYVLRIVTFGEEGEIKLIEDGEEFRLSDLEDSDSDEEFKLSQLPELFKRLPDNRYRLILVEGETERVVLDFIIREGQPIEAEAVFDGDVTPTETESPAEATRDVLPEISGDSSARGSLAEPDRTSAITQLGRQRTLAAGGILLTAGMIQRRTPANDTGIPHRPSSTVWANTQRRLQLRQLKSSAANAPEALAGQPGLAD